MSDNKPLSKKYTDEQVELALQVLAMCGGNSRDAQERLAPDFHLPARTLQDWKHRHAARYEQICLERGPDIDRYNVMRARELVYEYSVLESEAIEATRQALREGTIKDPSTAARNAATAKALQYDKVINPLEGRPSVITEHRSPDELIRRLEALGVIDGTAEETKELPA